MLSAETNSKQLKRNYLASSNLALNNLNNIKNNFAIIVNINNYNKSKMTALVCKKLGLSYCICKTSHFNKFKKPMNSV